jgi:alanyl-tRNA synthetase
LFHYKTQYPGWVVPGRLFTKQLGGATPAAATGQIGLFKILREASPGAGMRRIEAVTLKGVLDRYNSYDEIIADLVKIVNVSEPAIVKRIEEIMKRSRMLEKEIERLKKESISSNLDTIMADAKVVNGVTIVSHAFSGSAAEELRELSDQIRSKNQDSVVLFGSNTDGKALLLFAATNNAVKKGIDCGKIIKDVSRLVGGGGGGRKDMAQAGGKSPEGLDEAIRQAVGVAGGMIKGS